jgi:hypothetical protein
MTVLSNFFPYCLLISMTCATGVSPGFERARLAIMTPAANPPTTLRKGMNLFLKEMDVTFRRDSVTRRPRVNKEGSRLDTLQKGIGEYYYTRIRPQTDTKAEVKPHS